MPTKPNIFGSLIWKFLERTGTQGIQFVVQIVLARLLLPEDYGIIALVVVFLSLSEVFVDSGFNTALIQKKDADKTDFSSVFYLSLLLASVLYGVLYFSAPFIADFYRQPELIKVIRVLAVVLIFGALNSIQMAYMAKNMLFKQLFKSSLGAMLVSGAVGIATAYMGWGVWALVAQQITNKATLSLTLWFTVKWRPALLFSWTKLRSLFAFGSKLLASSLLDTGYREIRTLIIGRVYSPAALCLYKRGILFPQQIVGNINGSIQAVMLPALSAEQDDKVRVKAMVRRAITTSSFLIAPLMALLIASAEPMVRFLLTEKWMGAVIFVQIFSLSYVLMPIHTANLQAINALGRSDIFLRLEVIKKVVGITVLIITVPISIEAMAWGAAVNGVICSFINAHPNKKLLNYGYFEQIKDLLPGFILATFMGGGVYLLNYLELSDLLTLILQGFVGVTIYIVMAKLFKIESLGYFKSKFIELINKR
ncbi:MAG: lipopolysaccharide biosynthesis protein [Fibrobacter sp.]|nr:lipopolysaccharide biosynthesis protein [Fibrobacter sp.]